MATGNSHVWKLQGDYFEGCNCDSICPCLFLSDPDKGYCNVTVAWHIEKGYHDDTQLTGLNAVAVIVAPGNMFTGQKWKVAFYLDNSASQEQKEVLSKIFSGQSGGFFAAVPDHDWGNGCSKICPNNIWNGRKASLVTHPRIFKFRNRSPKGK